MAVRQNGARQMTDRPRTLEGEKTPRKPVYIPVSFDHLAIVQGAYYLLSGLWPLFSIASFMAVTGPKADIWLVKTVGLLIAVIGTVLLMAGIRRRRAVETVVLAIGSAASLLVVEIFYVATGVISLVYLLDGLVELILLGLWVAVLTRRSGSS
jgi:hypothetical protein